MKWLCTNKINLTEATCLCANLNSTNQVGGCGENMVLN